MKYCISDIHGCSKTLKALLNLINPTEEDTVYFLGDYVDRGPDSKGVLDIVMGMPNAICHKGNHEDMLLKHVDNPKDTDKFYHWIQNGGDECLQSFGGTIGAEYVEFIRGLAIITELEGFYLCHAGLSSDALNTPEQVLLWDRYCEVDKEALGGRRLVCGHTPTKMTILKHYVDSADKIIIDAGCVFTSHMGYGNLVALRLDDMKVFQQKNVDIKQ